MKVCVLNSTAGIKTNIKLKSIVTAIKCNSYRLNALIQVYEYYCCTGTIKTHSIARATATLYS